MEEIIELKQSIISHEWEKSLAIIEELEEMGRQDKINNLQSFLVIFLVRNSIINSLLEIQKRNKLGKEFHYIKQSEWIDSFEASLPRALIKTSQEVFSGTDLNELKSLVDLQTLKNQAFELLDGTYNSDPLQAFDLVRNTFPITKIK